MALNLIKRTWTDGETVDAQKMNTIRDDLGTLAFEVEDSETSARAAAEQALAEARRASDAADRAEAIVGGKFVSYGQAQGLSDAQKEQAKDNIALGGLSVINGILYVTYEEA